MTPASNTPSEPGGGAVRWAPDYGLPILKDTGCKTGAHMWVSIKDGPKLGDPCMCGLRVWVDEKRGGGRG